MQSELTALDRQIVQAQSVLADMKGQKGAKKDAVTHQTGVVTDLQAQLKTVQTKINAIDAQIGYGGCAV